MTIIPSFRIASLPARNLPIRALSFEFAAKTHILQFKEDTDQNSAGQDAIRHLWLHILLFEEGKDR